MYDIKNRLLPIHMFINKLSFMIKLWSHSISNINEQRYLYERSMIITYIKEYINKHNKLNND